MGYQENGIGFTDQAMASFNEASMPVGHSRPHHGHPQLRVVGMVNFPGKTLRNFSSGEIWVPKSVTDMIFFFQRADCLLRWRACCSQCPWNVPFLERGKDTLLKDRAVHDMSWERWGVKSSTSGLEKTELCHFMPRQHHCQYFGTNRTLIWPYGSAGTSLTRHT